MTEHRTGTREEWRRARVELPELEQNPTRRADELARMRLSGLNSDAVGPGDCCNEKDLQTQAFLRAADGIRTRDLLHGKQSAWFPLSADIPCKRAVPGPEPRSSIPRLSPGDHGGLGTQWAPRR